MSTNEDDLKIKVSSEGVEESASAFSRLNRQLEQSVAWVQQQAKQSTVLTQASEKQAKGLKGLIGELQNLHQSYRTGQTTGAEFGGVISVLNKGIGALISPIGLAVIGLGALVAAIHKAAQEAIQTKKRLEEFGVAAGTNARESDVMLATWDLAGASAETLRMAMFRLGTEVETGGEILGRYGVATTGANGKTKKAAELFEEFRTKTQGLSNAQRNLALQQMFGRVIAAQLSTAMATSNEEFDRYREIAENTSVVNEDYMQKAKALEDAQKELARRTMGVRLEFTQLIALPVAGFFADLTTSIMQFSVKAVSRLKTVYGWVQLLTNPLAFGMQTANEPDAPKAVDTPKATATVVEPPEPFSDAAKQLADREIQIDIDKRRQQLKVDEDYFGQVAQLMTGSMQTTLLLKRQTIEESMALAEEEFQRRVENERKLSPVGFISPEKLQTLERERDQKLFEGKNELRMLDLAREKSALEDATKLREDQFVKEKAILDVRAKLLDSNRQREVTMLELSTQTSERQILGRYEIEQRFIAQNTTLKTTAIDNEIASLRRSAEAYKNNADLQREVNNRIIGLQRDRIMAEQDSNREILDSRKALVDKLIGEAQREAGAAGNLTSRAIANIRAKGKQSFSQSDIQSEIVDIQRRGTETAATFAGGGKVKASAFEEAQATQGSFKDLASLGSTITGAIMTMSQMMLKAFRGDLSPQLPSTVTPTGTGFESKQDAFTDAGGRAREAPINLALERAREEFRQAREAQMAAAGGGGTAIGGTTSQAAVGGTTDMLQTKIASAATKAVEAMDFGRIFDAFADTLVRKLEFEAQRG